MIRKFCSLVFCVVALLLLLAGCSSHPPSAAQFMNVKEAKDKQGETLVVGGVLRTGDIYNGRYKFENSYISAEGVGNLDLSFFYRYSHIVIGANIENLSFRAITGWRSRYTGLQIWGGGSISPVDRENSPIYGGLMLIEEYPINADFRIGASEHLSRNGYFVDENLGWGSTYSTGFYNEFGIGTYLAYKNFSFEFRYGREIGEPRNRFYFMTNYAAFN
jgi:hypothetical protein